MKKDKKQAGGLQGRCCPYAVVKVSVACATETGILRQLAQKISDKPVGSCSRPHHLRRGILRKIKNRI